jgi:hypothetical protein
MLHPQEYSSVNIAYSSRCQKLHCISSNGRMLVTTLHNVERQDVITSNGRMIVNAAVASYCTAITSNVVTGENQDTLQPRWQMFRPRFEASTSRMLVKSQPPRFQCCVRHNIGSKTTDERHKKGKLFLCLTKQAPLHEDVRGSGCIAPHILNLDNIWRWVVSFTTRPQYPLDRRPGGPRSRSGRYGEVKILAPTGTRTPTPEVQSLACHYTDWTILFPRRERRKQMKKENERIDVWITN